MPEFVKKAKRGSRKKDKKLYFCQIGRSGFESILFNFTKDGWDVTQHDDCFMHMTRKQIISWYESRKKYGDFIPEESYAIVRHPMARIESHIKSMIYSKKAHRKENDFFDFIDLSIDKMHEKDLGRSIIPAVDCVLFDATVIQYEIGSRKIADYFVENKVVDKWTKNILPRGEKNVRIDWSKCPDSLRDKILKTYEQDFEAFDYDPDDYFKA